MGVAGGGGMRQGVLGNSNFIFPCMLYSATCDNTMIYLIESVIKRNGGVQDSDGLNSDGSNLKKVPLSCFSVTLSHLFCMTNIFSLFKSAYMIISG